MPGRQPTGRRKAQVPLHGQGEGRRKGRRLEEDEEDDDDDDMDYSTGGRWRRR